jgi:ribbon-helix-helix CopG family protein
MTHLRRRPAEETSKPINLSLPYFWAQALDEECIRRNVNRSQLIRMAIQAFLPDLIIPKQAGVPPTAKDKPLHHHQ